MKLNFFFLFLFVTMCISCAKKPAETPREEQKPVQKEEPKTAAPQDEAKGTCYNYFGKQDSVYLNISETYGIMTGLLMYRYHKKPQDLGTIEGKMVGDVLLAEYSYKLGSAYQIKQVAFKKSGDDLIEGIGILADVNGKKLFKDFKSVKFGPSRTLKKVPCKN